jgi:predicted AAA+ superfamily ATPase
LKKYGDINYYQKSLGAEIDFIIDKKIACEVKITGNKNDYANNSTNQILFIIPIFNTIPETIQGISDSITALNKLYIGKILDNIVIGENYNFKTVCL